MPLPAKTLGPLLLRTLLVLAGLHVVAARLLPLLAPLASPGSAEDRCLQWGMGHAPLIDDGLLVWGSFTAILCPFLIKNRPQGALVALLGGAVVLGLRVLHPELASEYSHWALVPWVLALAAGRRRPEDLVLCGVVVATLWGGPWSFEWLAVSLLFGSGWMAWSLFFPPPGARSRKVRIGKRWKIAASAVLVIGLLLQLLIGTALGAAAERVLCRGSGPAGGSLGTLLLIGASSLLIGLAGVQGTGRRAALVFLAALAPAAPTGVLAALGVAVLALRITDDQSKAWPRAIGATRLLNLARQRGRRGRKRAR